MSQGVNVLRQAIEMMNAGARVMVEASVLVAGKSRAANVVVVHDASRAGFFVVKDKARQGPFKTVSETVNAVLRGGRESVAEVWLHQLDAKTKKIASLEKISIWRPPGRAQNMQRAAATVIQAAAARRRLAPPIASRPLAPKRYRSVPGGPKRLFAQRSGRV